MVFSSPGFIFFFFPVFFLLYFLTRPSYRNLVIFIFSVLFYSVDAGSVTVVLIASVLVNYYGAELITRQKSENSRNILLALGVILNLLPLFYFKYWGFIAGSIYDVMIFASPASDISTNWGAASIILPAGISFFTFQGISYLVDAKRRETGTAPNLIAFGMYHTLFPQLIAGPIVRYKEVEHQIVNRSISFDRVYAGIIQFELGLGKKLILADPAGTVADHIFGLNPVELSSAAAWAGIVAYTVQIFFDFSGYSDMAIGLGRILGFDFPANFDQPYRARNITEFWRRWHMTLSRWFRDYVYIPLGGNRASAMRTYFNLGLVFVLCGLWHGAAYTFLAWGAWHGLWLVIERILYHRWGWRPSGAVGWMTTILIIMLGWVLFRSPDLHSALLYGQALAGFGEGVQSLSAMHFITSDKITFIVIAAVLSVLPASMLRSMPSSDNSSVVQYVWSGMAGFLVFAYAVSMVAANSFNPFIYFRF
ncbi:MAG: MBOAT family O-acyltransferase [Allorhizobium sp.]